MIFESLSEDDKCRMFGMFVNDPTTIEVYSRIEKAYGDRFDIPARNEIVQHFRDLRTKVIFMFLEKGASINELPLAEQFRAEAAYATNESWYLLTEECRAYAAKRLYEQARETQYPTALEQANPDDELWNYALEGYLQHFFTQEDQFHYHMQRKYPQLNDLQREAFFRKVAAVSSLSYPLFEQVYDKKITTTEAYRAIREVYPWVNDRNMASLENQGMYSAWHG